MPDLGISAKLKQLPEPVQPWVKTYSARPGYFAGDAIGLLISSAFNPFSAFPYWVAYFAAAQPLGALDAVPGDAYSDEATSGYQELVHNLGPACAAGVAGGLLLSALFRSRSRLLHSSIGLAAGSSPLPAWPGLAPCKSSSEQASCQGCPP